MSGRGETRARRMARIGLAVVLAISAVVVSAPPTEATAAAISAATFSQGVEVAFVATGTTFPDSLAAGSPAGRGKAPILLTAPSERPATTRTELEGLSPKSIVILGGPAAVGAGVETALRSLTAGGVTRIAGADRFATAALISARYFVSGAPVACVAPVEPSPTR